MEDPKNVKKLTLGALGVVYGDIGTSPLYTLREVLHTEGMGDPQHSIYGTLSMMIWALIFSVTLKYVWTMLRANNNGEGGIMALLALTLRQNQGAKTEAVLITMGIFGAALFYGDCVITPSISVLSAIEGISLITPIFNSYVVPLAVLIMVVLFSIQKGGTTKMGKMFGPIMVVWFLSLGLLGVHINLNLTNMLSSLIEE